MRFRFKKKVVGLWHKEPQNTYPCFCLNPHCFLLLSHTASAFFSGQASEGVFPLSPFLKKWLRGAAVKLGSKDSTSCLCRICLALWEHKIHTTHVTTLHVSHHETRPYTCSAFSPSLFPVVVIYLIFKTLL